MPKKQNVKKPKAPRKRRATASKGKAGAKDKSVKQNVNVNVTSSGGGGSGGTALPSAQPSYHPLMTASMQGQKLGEDINIKKLTDLLNKTITQASKPSQNIVEKATEKVVEVPNIQPNIETISRQQPIFEGDVFTTDYQINRKPSEEHKTLLERLNTPQSFDEKDIINENPQVEEAQNANVEHVFEGEEMSKPDNPEEDIEFLENIADDNNDFQIDKTLVKKNKIPIDKVILQTEEYYKYSGAGEPLLYDEDKQYYFKIIDGILVPWNSNDTRGPLKEYVKKYVKSHYSLNPEDLQDIKNDTIINYGTKPNQRQLNLFYKYKSAIEKAKQAKEEVKVSKGKKTKKQNVSEI